MKAQGACWPFSPHEDTTNSLQPKRAPPPNMSQACLEHLASRTVRYKFLLFLSYSGFSTFVKTAQMDHYISFLCNAQRFGLIRRIRWFLTYTMILYISVFTNIILYDTLFTSILITKMIFLSINFPSWYNIFRFAYILVNLKCLFYTFLLSLFLFFILTFLFIVDWKYLNRILASFKHWTLEVIVTSYSI